MKVVLAIDSFKGCLSSSQAEEAAEIGIRNVMPDADIVKIPVTDGGDGMLDAFIHVLNAKVRTVNVFDPLRRVVQARYAVTCDGLAIIESAQACGIMHLRKDELNPLQATSYGVGEILADAITHGYKKIIVGLGGSGTSDCGMGMLDALISRFGHYDNWPNTILSQIDIVVLSDVTNPLYGFNGAAAIFGPQKGATPEMIDILDRKAVSLAEKFKKIFGYDRSQDHGAGAAGGLGYAFLQFLNAKIRSGADFYLESINFNSLIDGADLIFTGEGSADKQTLMGKIPSIVLRRANARGIKVVLMAGKVSDRESLLDAGFSSIININEVSKPGLNIMESDVAIDNIVRSVSKCMQV